jgi:hypothetical protein
VILGQVNDVSWLHHALASSETLSYW